MRLTRMLSAVAVVLIAAGVAAADVKVTVDHNANDAATPEFKFPHVPQPAKDDAATKASLSLIEGQKDENSGDLAKLTDGLLPTEQDQPSENFFFAAGTPGGRLKLDLGSVIEVASIDSYSWHPNSRAPQVYKVYVADGSAPNFNPDPRDGKDPTKCGWRLVAAVDTRPKDGAAGGGQYGVNIADPAGSLGKARYVLFDIAQTDPNDQYSNTFYSEIDVNEKR